LSNIKIKKTVFSPSLLDSSEKCFPSSENERAERASSAFAPKNTNVNIKTDAGAPEEGEVNTRGSGNAPSRAELFKRGLVGAISLKAEG